MLPEKFTERLHRDLGDAEAEALIAALESESPTSVRLHPQKCADRDALVAALGGGNAVPWNGEGVNLKVRPSFTLDPAFHGGAYYVQEAASQVVGHLLGGELIRGKRVVDLCAAPGGKTTLYSSLVGAEGLVVANEIDRRRAQVLADNVRKWGEGNVVVTCADARRLADFEAWFDVVAVDAPCSGEGMFRKDPNAREEWSEGNVKLCAERQNEILQSAWRMLKPGGTLLYSTCTFNRLEDEGTLERLLADVGEDVIEAEIPDIPAEWGVTCGEVGPFKTFRFYPHRTSGEGFFAAVARKSEDARGKTRTPKPQRKVITAADRATVAELSRWVAEPGKICFGIVADTCYAWYEAQADAVRRLSEVLPVVCSGVAMGQIFKGRLKPDHALAMFVGLDRSAVNVAELDNDTALGYLRCNAVPADLFREGMNLAVCRGYALGFAKRIGARINNLYPNMLRIQKL